MRGLAIVLGLSCCVAACGGRSHRGQGAPAEPGGPAAGSAGVSGAAGSAGLPPPEGCFGIAPEATEAELLAAVSAKLGLSVPAGSVEASEPNIFVRGQQLVDAVELAFERQPLPAPSRQIMRDFVGQLIGENLFSLPAALPADEQALYSRQLDRFTEHWAGGRLDSPDFLLTGAPPEALGAPPEQLAGIMTLGAFLARVPSPPARALYLAETLGCTPVPPPPPIMMSTWDSQPKQPAKNVVLGQYGDDQTPCVACHTHYIGYAIALDRYDELGRYRESLNGQAIDTGYSLTMPAFYPHPAANDGQRVEFATPSELGRALSEAGGVRACLVRKLNETLSGSALTDEEVGCLLDDWAAANNDFVALLALLAPRFAIAP